MKYFLEILLTKIIDENIHYKQVKVDITGKTDNPDDLVLFTIQKYNQEIIQKNRLISHSTSWRYEPSGSTIITYIVYSDDFDFEGDDVRILPINQINILESGDPSKPRPTDITLESVVSHGVRHISYLVTNTPSVYQSVLNQNTVIRFKEIDIALAGKI